MTLTGLLEIIRNGESSGIEFKRDDIDNRAFAKEIVALANHLGGRVLLGVEDDGSISGITRPAARLEEWVMGACRDKIRPELIPFFEIVREAAPGKDVAIVTVEPGYAVHAVWHNQHRTYYKRAGTVVSEASNEELEQLFQRRGNLRVELKPVSGTGLDALDLDRLADYFGRIRQQPHPAPAERESWEALLVNTELMARGEAGIVCTVAGLLIFGKNPNRFLPHAGIDAVAYPGAAPDYQANERTALRGPMVPLQGAPGFGEGLVERAITFALRHLSTETGLEGGVRRMVHVDFPTEVLREALVNALVHRDYLLSATDIQFSIFSDRIEIVSPGRLPNGITPARMIAGCRAARNQLIKDIMRDYGYLEHMGMGIPRKIVAGMRVFNGTEPELHVEEESFRLVLRR